MPTKNFLKRGFTENFGREGYFNEGEQMIEYAYSEVVGIQCTISLELLTAAGFFKEFSKT